MSTPNLRIHTTFLPHEDPEASLAFYRDVLGFEVRQDVGQGAMRWITVAPPGDEDGPVLVLAPPVSDPGVSEEERRTVSDLMAKGSWAMLILRTPDLDATFERLAASGAEVVQEPMDQPWGVRDAAVRDPAGTMVRINQA